MSPKELLEQLNELGERPTIEAKTASAMGKSVLETVSAFSNEPGLGGGWILLGVSRDASAFDTPYVVAGLANPEQLSADFASQCATSFNHPLRVRIESGLVNGGGVLAVFVPEAEASEKPIFIRREGLPRGAFRRIGSADVRCTDDDLEMFLHERRGETFDAALIPDAAREDLDAAAIEEYRRLRLIAKPTAEELNFPDEDLLFALKAMGREPSGHQHPTRAGLLLFGRSVALRRWFPMMRIDYIRVPGVQWVEDPDRRYETVEIRAPIIDAIRRARAAILDDLPKAFSLPPGQLHRRDIPLVPDRVIREAVVNAVMHRSYRVHGAIQIIRYANRLEIRNPGHSLVAGDRLGEPHSRTRNPLIAAVLHDTDLAETKGSGIRVMRELMTEAGLAAPAFASDREADCFVVTLLFHHFLTPEDWAWLGSFQELALSDDDARALVFVRENGVITNSLYRDVTRVDVLTASHRLGRLRDHGLIEQHGRGSDTHYTPTEKLLAPWQRGMGESGRQSGELSTQHGGVSGQSGESPPHHGELTRKDLPEDLRTALQQSTLREPRPALEKLVLRLCTWRDLSTDEIARLLSRNRSYVRDNVLPPLLRTGKLTRTHPEQPSHPQQRYRAIAP